MSKSSPFLKVGGVPTGGEAFLDLLPKITQCIAAAIGGDRRGTERERERSLFNKEWEGETEGAGQHAII